MRNKVKNFFDSLFSITGVGFILAITSIIFDVIGWPIHGWFFFFCWLMVYCTMEICNHFKKDSKASAEPSFMPRDKWDCEVFNLSQRGGLNNLSSSLANVLYRYKIPPYISVQILKEVTKYPAGNSRDQRENWNNITIRFIEPYVGYEEAKKWVLGSEADMLFNAHFDAYDVAQIKSGVRPFPKLKVQNG